MNVPLSIVLFQKNPRSTSACFIRQFTHYECITVMIGWYDEDPSNYNYYYYLSCHASHPYIIKLSPSHVILHPYIPKILPHILPVTYLCTRPTNTNNNKQGRTYSTPLTSPSLFCVKKECHGRKGKWNPSSLFLDAIIYSLFDRYKRDIKIKKLLKNIIPVWN